MSQDHQKKIIVLLLILIPLGIFYQVGGHEFINMDDPFFIQQHNVPAGLTWGNIKQAFIMHDCLWMPLTWISHMADSQLYGLEPTGHHYTSLTIHIINSLLLFLLFFRMSGKLWQSALLAALLALHPINVESVAYLSARKGLLSSLFWLLAMLAYYAYTRDKTWHYYTLALLFFLCGAMSKPSIVALPPALLIMDYWPLSRFRDTSPAVLITEKIPFFLLAGAVSILAVITQKGAGTVLPIETAPLSLRIENALVSYVMYLWKTIWPMKLAIFYPYPRSLPTWQSLTAGGMLVVMTMVALCLRRHAPYVLAGWLWFLITLLPAIGIIKTGQQAMADRYAYIPLIGIFIIAAWGANDIKKRNIIKPLYLHATAAILLFLFAGLAYRQVQYWQNSRTVFQHAVTVTSGNYLAYNNLGEALVQEGLSSEANQAFTKALEIVPGLPQANTNLGRLLMNRGQISKAVTHFERAIQSDPDYTDAHYHLARAYLQEGSPAKADIHFQTVLVKSDQPTHKAQSHKSRGVFLAQQQRFDEARHHFEEALKIAPDLGEVHNSLGQILLLEGEREEAIRHFQKALTFCPGHLEPVNHLADIYKQAGAYINALELYQHLLVVRPDCSATLCYNIAAMYALMQDRDNAVDWLQKSVANGFSRFDILGQDSDFESIRNTDGYKSLMTTIR